MRSNGECAEDVEEREVNTQKMDNTIVYVISNIEGLDAITVYVTDYKLGQGKIVIECFNEVWSYYWGAMGDCNLTEFFISADNDYLLGKMLNETMQTDFEEINDTAHKRGFDICVTSDVEIAMSSQEMDECFGTDWPIDLPRCHTREYKYLSRIINVVRSALAKEV